MDMVKIDLCGRLYDAIPLEEYYGNRDAYTANQTAIVIDGHALPVVNANDINSKIGICVTPGRIFSKVNLPKTDEELQEYGMDKAINLSNSKDIKELLEKQEAVRNIEYEMLTTVDNITIPRIGADDTPAAKAIKDAVLAKHIDLDKYEARFGSNYPNYKRLLLKDRISIGMLTIMCDALDIRATLTLTDKNPDVPNPINRTIQVELTGGDVTDASE